jgi:hypothetical protein
VNCHTLSLAVVVFAGLAVGGCGTRAPRETEVPPSYENLCLIRDAYLKATIKLDRAPRDLSEIKSYFKHPDSVETILRSPNDGEPYAILWGVDFRTVPAQGNNAPVLAYEQHGQSGKRYVLRMRDVSCMTDEEFQKVPFPAGHNRPSL